MDSFEPKSLKEWDDWLSTNHSSSNSIWLILSKKESGLPFLEVNDVIETALCYGWIDSLPNKLDDKRFKLRFSPRNPKSNWSKVNKEKVSRLISKNRMKAPGLAMVDLAKKSGTWSALDEVENLVIPDDLQNEFAKYSHASSNFDAFPKSVKRGILEWLFNAKQEQTRTKRIQEIAEKAQENIRVNQYR